VTNVDGGRISVFLGGPFEGLLGPDGMDSGARDLYQALIEHLESAGCEVFSAHRNEDWGRALLPPSECTSIDFDAVSSCDVFVAIPGDPASLGTHVEIGWASALGKPLVLLTGSAGARCALVRGLETVAAVDWVTFEAGQTDFSEVVACVLRRTGHVATPRTRAERAS